MGDTSGMTMKDSTQPVLAHYFTYRLNTLSKLNDMASQAMYTAHTGLTLPEVRTLAAVGGRAMWKKVMPLIEQRNDALLGCLGARERAQLLDIFERLLAQEKTAQLE